MPLIFFVKGFDSIKGLDYKKHMKLIAYLSTASKWWTIDRQRVALAPILPHAAEFVDDDDSFTNRDNSVRVGSSRQPATYHVASLAVLAKRQTDFQAFVRKLFGLGWTLVVYNGEPQQTLQTADEAVAAWQEARRQSKMAGAAKHGGQATKERFELLYRDKCEPFREHWGDPRFDTDWILEQAGVSRNTMVKYMKATRLEAIRANRPRLLAQAQRQRRKAEKEGK